MNLTAWLNQRAATAAAVPEPADPPAAEATVADEPIYVPAKILAALEAMRDRTLDGDPEVAPSDPVARSGRIKIRRSNQTGGAVLTASDRRKAIRVRFAISEPPDELGVVGVLPTPEDVRTAPVESLVPVFVDRAAGQLFDLRLLVETLTAMEQIAAYSDDGVREVCLVREDSRLILQVRICGGEATAVIADRVNNDAD